MNKRNELETELAAAEANCRRANDAFDKVAVDRAKAVADWDLSAADRLKQGADIDALSRKVADRQSAYAAKSKAEVEWSKAESILHQAELDWENAQARLDAATAKRDQIAAALDQLTALGFGARPGKWRRRWIKQLKEVFGPAATLTTSARHPDSGRALAAPSLLRQAVGLSCLTLAYLQYYYLDVQLQIMSLPSVTVFLYH